MNSTDITSRTELRGNIIHTYYYDGDLLKVESHRLGRLAPTYYTKLHGEWVMITYDEFQAEYRKLYSMGLS